MNDLEKIEWCIERHKATNHFYDTYLPYEFHLRMVVQVCKDFAYLYPNNWSELEIACWGHDLIEDTRTSYNDCKQVLGEWAADVIYAVSNEKGRNRKERANRNYYLGIRTTEGAPFVKICDRIANVQYSKLTQSRMFDMYKKENENFILNIGHEYEYTAPMYKYLLDLLNIAPNAPVSNTTGDQERTES